MFGLEDKHINFIKEILENNVPNAKYYIFVSRAKGTYKKYSDVDIAIDNSGQSIDTNTLGKLLLIFQDSTFPYEIDIIDLNSIDKNFRNIINSSLIQF